MSLLQRVADVLGHRVAVHAREGRCRRWRRRAAPPRWRARLPRRRPRIRTAQPMLLQQRHQGLAVVLVVLDHEDPRTPAAPAAAAAKRRGRRGGSRPRPAAGGRRTRCRGRALRCCATTVPPCSSTRVRTSVRPMPRPPSARTSVRSACLKRSKISGSSSGSMPTPVSRNESTASPPSALRVTSTRPPAGVYLMALVRRLETTWSRRVASPEIQTGEPSTRSRTSHALLGRAPARRHRRARRTISARSTRPLLAAATLPGGHAGHVEEVVHQPREDAPLAADGRRLPRDDLRASGSRVVLVRDVDAPRPR